MKKIILSFFTLFLFASNCFGYSDQFKGLKDGIYFNYIKIGYYHDETASNMNDDEFVNHLDEFKEIGFTGVMFELSVSVDAEGELLETLQYEKLERWIQLAKNEGMGVAVMPNWTFNNENAVYVNQFGINELNIADTFSYKNFFSSIKNFWKSKSVAYELLNVDLIIIGLFDDQSFFDQSYRLEWEEIFSNTRENFSGAVTVGFNKFDLYSDTEVKDIHIWDLTDAIAVWAKAYISDLPIYDIDLIQEKFWNPEKNPKGFIQEYLEAVNIYSKPLMLMDNAFALDNGLDGGWDPTPEQLEQYPSSLNYDIFDLEFSSFIHHFNNHLSDYVTSWTFGNWEVWGFLGWQNWFYYDLTQFPSRTKEIFKDLFNDGLYQITNKVTASSRSEKIFVPLNSNSSWVINAGGGEDQIRMGPGDDLIILSRINDSRIEIKFDLWVNAKNEQSDITISVDEEDIFTKHYDSDFINCEDSYPCWVSVEEEILFNPLPEVSNLKIKITGSFISINSILLSDGIVTVEPDVRDSIRPELPDWAQENWIVSEAILDISSFNRVGEISVFGGKGLDKLEIPAGYNSKNIIKISEIERVLDGDNWVAYDLDSRTGNSGKAVKIIAATYGLDAINNKTLLGNTIKLIDDGMSMQDVVQKLTYESFGDDVSYKDIVTNVFMNIFNAPPTNYQLNFYSGILESGKHTVGRLVLMGVNHAKNLGRIDWEGLQTTGIEYIPAD